MKNLISDDLMNYYNEALISRYIIDGKRPLLNDSNIENQQEGPFIAPKSLLPILTKFEVRCKSKFRGDDSGFDHVENHRNGFSQQEELKKFTVNVKFFGSDVLNSFSSIAQTSVSSSCNECKFFENPLPNWLKKSACRGRNFVEIENRGRRQIIPEGGNLIINTDQVGEVRDDDAMSIAASEMTNWGGRDTTQFCEQGMHSNQNKNTGDIENNERNVIAGGVHI